MQKNSVLSLAQLLHLVRPVARSFYLSLRCLPPALSAPITLAYLLARLSDTVADAPAPFTTARRDLLSRLQDAPLNVAATAHGFPLSASPAEAALWQAWPQLQATLAASAQREEILRVWQRILQGQIFDLDRVFHHTQGIPLDWDDLLEYTDQVAGCVGVFWNRVGFVASPPWSVAPPEFLFTAGQAYGCALQLINICRDASKDRELGRRYLQDEDRERALEKLATGLELGERVAASIIPRRARLATALPGSIAAAMIPGLRKGEATRLRRTDVYRLLTQEMWRSFLVRPRWQADVD